MVQKYQSPVRVYKYPFELVMAAYQKRFPTCKMIPVFLGSEITSEYNSEDGAIHVVERKCRLNVEAPYLLKKIAGVEFVYFIQHNSLDRRSRTLSIKAHNETFSSRIVVSEHCRYSVHPDNSEWTCFEQEASLDIKSFFGFESTVEKIAMKQYSQNIQKGKEIIEFYVNELIACGQTEQPRWSPPSCDEKQDDDDDESTPPPLLTSGAVSTSKQQLPAPAAPARKADQDSHSDLELGATAASFGPTSLEEPPIDEKSEKLDTEYIQRFLGELTPVQESRLIQLRRWLQETYKGKTPRHTHILRFLKARDYSLEKTREMLCHSLAWRKRHGIDRILETYKPAQVIMDYYAGGWHYFDRDGRPLYILRLGQMDVKGLVKAVGEEGLLKHVLYVNEEGIKKAEKATRHLGHPVRACTCVVDLEGLNMRHLWRPGIKALLHVIEMVEANYPETMGRLLIVRAPRIFPVLWTLVNPFIDETTREKFMIYGGNDFKGVGGLVDFIDEQYIPDFLGGDCFCDVPQGGMVPKALYQLEYDAEMDVEPFDMPLCPESLYHTAYVVRDYPHEMLIHVPERGCVVTWDFDILKGDVIFTLFRCRKAISEDPHQHHVHGASGSGTSTQYMDKHCLIGLDVTIVLAPVVCRESDSVQGSHVTLQSGSYILQWKVYESGKGRNPHSFDFPSIHGHKCKIMFYTELLSSKDYRGSMSSLQSLQSSFSSLSVNTTQSSANPASLCPSR